jgi:hypothetical protein
MTFVSSCERSRRFTGRAIGSYRYKGFERGGLDIVRSFMKLVLFICVALVASPRAFAEQIATTEAARWIEEASKAGNSKNFSNWNGVIFICYHGAKSNDVLDDICARSKVNAEFLAASAKVNLAVTKDYFEYALKSIKEGRLKLEVYLSSTKPGSPTAIHARMRAYLTFSNAIEANKPGLARGVEVGNTPREGDLIVWENSAIGASSGSGKDLVEPMGSAVDSLLKSFFTEFLVAQR